MDPFQARDLSAPLKDSELSWIHSCSVLAVPLRSLSGCELSALITLYQVLLVCAVSLCFALVSLHRCSSLAERTAVLLR